MTNTPPSQAEKKCPHIDCLVNHNGAPCNCNMARWCPVCKGEYSGKLPPAPSKKPTIREIEEILSVCEARMRSDMRWKKWATKKLLALLLKKEGELIGEIENIGLREMTGEIRITKTGWSNIKAHLRTKKGGGQK